MDSCSDEEKLARTNSPAYFSGHNHIRVTRVEGAEAEGVLDIQPESLNPAGIVHGGALVTLADTVAGVAAWAGGRVCVTLDSSMQYLSPGRGKQITCTATPKKQGRTILVYDAALTDETGKLVAIGTYTFFVTQRQVEDTALAGGGTAG